jgi:excisionase family DNA binding protein
MKEFLSTSEVCDYLNVSRSCVYKLSFKNVLPKYCPGGKKIYFKKTEVDDYINKSRIASQNELNAEAELEMYKTRRIKK